MIALVERVRSVFVIEQSRIERSSRAKPAHHVLIPNKGHGNTSQLGTQSRVTALS